jgi:hypothetical protein
VLPVHAPRVAALQPRADGLITVDDPAHIAKLVKRAGLLTVDEIAWLAETLAAAFPPA